MLSHIERKILRIIINVSHYGTLERTPTIKQLAKWTGRREREVYNVLARLAHKGFLDWSIEKPEHIKLLKTNERF